MAKKNTRKKQKKISVKEFKAWIEGIEELQPDGWAPTAEQWKIIRERINMIDDTPSGTPSAKHPLHQNVPVTNVKHPVTNTRPVVPPPAPQSAPTPSPSLPTGGSMLDDTGLVSGGGNLPKPSNEVKIVGKKP